MAELSRATAQVAVEHKQSSVVLLFADCSDSAASVHQHCNDHVRACLRILVLPRYPANIYLCPAHESAPQHALVAGRPWQATCCCTHSCWTHLQSWQRLRQRRSPIPPVVVAVEAFAAHPAVPFLVGQSLALQLQQFTLLGRQLLDIHRLLGRWRPVVNLDPRFCFGCRWCC